MASSLCLTKTCIGYNYEKQTGPNSTLCLWKSKCWPKLELLEIRRHRLVLVGFACLASAPYPIVLADAAASALFAYAPSPIVLANALPTALPALVPYPTVLADASPSAVPALAPLPIVLADALPSALLATVSYPIELAEPLRLCSQMLPPPHSLHRLFSRLCSLNLGAGKGGGDD